MFDSSDGDDDELDEPARSWVADPAAKISTEPEEFDPDSIGPEIPSLPDSESASSSPAVRLFWRLVVVFDVALLGLALGPMFVFFEGDLRTGIAMFALGAIAFAYGVARYYRFRADQDDGADE